MNEYQRQRAADTITVETVSVCADCKFSDFVKSHTCQHENLRGTPIVYSIRPGGLSGFLRCEYKVAS